MLSSRAGDRCCSGSGSFVFLCIFAALCVLFPLAAQEENEDALLLYRQGRYEESVNVCLRELAGYDDSQLVRRMDAYSVLGWSLVRLKRYEDALKYGREALGFSRYDTRIVENLGEVHYYLGNHDKALNSFQQYVSLNPSGDRIARVYYFMGETYIRREQFYKADMALSTAVYHEPAQARWWSRLGYAREEAGQLNTARQAYEKALGLRPSLQEARKGLERIAQQG